MELGKYIVARADDEYFRNELVLIKENVSLSNCKLKSLDNKGIVAQAVYDVRKGELTYFFVGPGFLPQQEYLPKISNLKD